MKDLEGLPSDKVIMTNESLRNAGVGRPGRRLRLAYFVSHPIQYQAPLLRRIAQETDIDLKVYFFSDISVRGHVDPGFGVALKWDVPLVAGYQHEFLPRRRDSGRLSFSRPLNWGIYKRLRDGQYDAVWVHGYAMASALQVILAARSLGIPVLMRAESTLFDRPRSRQKTITKALFFRALKTCISAVLSIGDANSAYWRHYLGEEMPIFPFNYSVDNEFFQQRCREASVTREDFRRELQLEPGRCVILYASKLQTRKRCGDLLEAFLRLASEHTIEPLPYLLIVGDGEERTALQEQAKSARPGDVRFLGFQNQTALPRFFDLCDVFVLASVDEPWGLVVNEVMNAGKAIIVSSEVGCQKNLVEDGVNGCVVRARDVDGLANSLNRVLADPQRSREMGLKSLEKIHDFSFEQNVSGLRNALEAVVPAFKAVRRSPQWQYVAE
jgi:glycosyltransferase involved in cell wall biosynthesis